MTVLDDALVYAARGWRVVPIIPGQKRPPMDAWQQHATTDQSTIRQWWDRWPDHGVGIATGTTSGLFVLDVDVDSGKHGDETLADLTATHGPLPHTVEAITGSGGRHIYFTMPLLDSIRNDAGKRLGPGLDIRGEGGQVVAPPTWHANGTAYQWEASSDPDHTQLAEAPAWLIDLLTAEPAAPTPRAPSSSQTGRPGDQWADQTDWHTILTADGATYLGTRRDHRSKGTYEMWARPGVDHASGTLYYGGTDLLKVFSSEWRANGVLLEQDATYTKIGYYTTTRHGGDFTAAAAALRAEGHGDPTDQPQDDWTTPVTPADSLTQPTTPSEDTEPPEGPQEATRNESWQPVDLAAVLADNYQAPVPTILARTDGEHMFYEARVNALNGESGSGKSWVELLAMREELLAGRHALMIDFEDHAESVASRFTELGVPRSTLIDLFHYINPDAPYTLDAAEQIEALVTLHNITVIGIDSVGEAMAVQALKQNDDDEVARWFRILPRRLARLGAAVIIVDHVPKAKDADALHAIGSQRKRAAIDGIAYRVDEIKPLGKGRHGTIRTTCAKDRNGHYSKKDVVALIQIDATSGTHIDHEIQVPPPKDGSAPFRPTSLMERLARELGQLNRQNIEPSQRVLLAVVPGDDKAKKQAIGRLVHEGYVHVEKVGNGHQHRLLKPYTQTLDPASDKADPLATEEPF